MGAVQTSYTVAPAAAYAGMLADDTKSDVMTMENAEASASMPFGIVVAFKTSSPGSDRAAVLPTTSETKLAGILVHSHDYERTFTLPDGSTVGELDSTGIKPGAEIAVMWRGTCWVKVQQAVVPGDRLFVCKSANVVYTGLGQVGNADESTNTIDASAIGRFTSGAAAGGFAKLQVDFSQKP
jgi:hypothetical protein